MSIKVISRVLSSSGQKQSALERLILVVIADRAHNDGSAYPGREYIAKKAQCAQESVSRSIKKLCKNGQLIARTYHSLYNRSRYDFIIPFGLSSKELQTTLVERFMISKEDAAKIVDEYITNGHVPPALINNMKILDKGNGKSRGGNGKSPDPLEYSSPDSSPDSERDPSLSHSKKTTNDSQKGSKASSEDKPLDFTAKARKTPPPSSASPPPQQVQMMTAMSEATGKQIKNSRRNRQEANKLLAKYTPEQIALLAPDGTWFQAIRPFGANSNPLHYSQIAEFMPQCLAWHDEPDKLGKYTFDDYSPHELEAIRQDATSVYSEATSNAEALPPSEAMSVDELDDLHRRLGL